MTGTPNGIICNCNLATYYSIVLYSLMVHWKQDPRNVVRLIGGINDGVAFTNDGGARASEVAASARTSGRSPRSRTMAMITPMDTAAKMPQQRSW
jgi:DNA primase